MLKLVTGNIREGKTLSMVERAHCLHMWNTYYEQTVPFYKRIKIYANFNLRYEEVEQVEVSDLLNLKGILNGLMCLDEAYSWLESRVSASKMNRYVSYFVFQSGKRGVDVIATAQLGSSIDLRFVELNHIQELARKDVVNRNFIYKHAVKCGVGVRIGTNTINWDKNASKFWGDYDTGEPVEPLGIEELQVEMEKLNTKKINRRIDDIVCVMMDDSVRGMMGWSNDRCVFKFQVEDLLLRWGKPLLLAPLVTNRLKCVLRAG